MSDPITMPWQAPVFPPPPHRWKGVQVAIFPFAPDPATVARILPPGMEPRSGMGLITIPAAEVLKKIDRAVSA